MKTIPKVCYLYWNDAPMSFLNMLTVVSFHKHNPDWRIIVYNFKQRDSDKNLVRPYVSYIGRDYFYEVRLSDYVEVIDVDVEGDIHSILVSDIWRREILYENGGVYSDFDMLWLRPMREFIHIDCIGDPENFEGIVSFFQYTYGFHNVSNLISEPGSPYLKSLIDEAGRVAPPYGDQSFGTAMLNRAYPNLESITQKHPRILAIKYETFYPYSTYCMNQLFIDNDIGLIDSKNVMGVHWFFGNPISKRFINEERYDLECSMTSILKKEGYI